MQLVLIMVSAGLVIKKKSGLGWEQALEPLGERGVSEDHLLHFWHLQGRCLYCDKGRWDPVSQRAYVGDMVGIEVMVPVASLP